VAGAIAAAAALGASELLAGIFRLPSLVEGLGNFVIDNVPKAVKDFAIEVFATNDKLALLIGIAVVTIGLGALVGIAARKRFWVATVMFIGLAVAAALAAARDPQVAIGLAVIPAGAAAISGLGGLQWLLGRSGSEGPDTAAEADSGRRRFIVGASALVGVAALSAGFGRVLVDRTRRAAAGRGDVVLPSAASPLPVVPAAADLEVAGLTPIHVPNADFYRIDTAFAVPSVDIQDWTLSVTGLVDSPYTIGYFDLLDMRMIESDITLSCVSNKVGGNLVGNARWLGVPLEEILDRAGIQPGAEQVVGRSVDDFTVGFPIEVARDGRDAMVAVGMNGEPLPVEHGFPARLVVPGLYGYVSATKWLSEIHLTTWDGFDAYWVPRGWSKEGPIKTQSRIDTPRMGESVLPGTVTVAGVAWAPTRGIDKVEVQLGEGASWREAELSEPLSDDAWVQWRIDWDAVPGPHVIRVRATDGNGELQTEEETTPAPNGATGWHTRSVSVEA
jgi:DMSO/TMAO reductase YedYZ molybdopterin-dependent catalytic subunit